MTAQNPPAAPDNSRWLTTYYFIRAGVSALWIALAFTLGRDMPAVAAGLLVAYPAWDALANLIDAVCSGGLKRNGSQALNLIISTLTAVAVVFALGMGMNAVLAVFGAWAALSGVLQLVTGIRRWKTGAQWAMVLSGAQSALAGAFFLKTSAGVAAPAIMIIPGYAAFGAVYFLISAVWLSVVWSRRTAKSAA